MILSMVEMVVLVAAVLIAGAVCGVIFYYLNNHGKRKGSFPVSDFSGGTTNDKMLNSDVSVDDIIKDFKLID